MAKAKCCVCGRPFPDNPPPAGVRPETWIRFQEKMARASRDMELVRAYRRKDHPLDRLLRLFAKGD